MFIYLHSLITFLIISIQIFYFSLAQTPLLPNEPIYFPISISNINTYTFTIPEDSDVFNVFISMYSFNGNSDWTLLRDKREVLFDYFNSYDNIQEYYLQTSEYVSTWEGDYALKVHGNLSGYVKLAYYFNINPQETRVDNNEIFLTKVRLNKDLKLVFTREIGVQSFWVSIFAVNCRIWTTPLNDVGEVSYDHHNQYIYNDYAHGGESSHWSAMERSYEYEVKWLDLDTKSTDPDEICRIYCVGHALNTSKEITLSEGIGYSIILSGNKLDNYNTVNFKYIFFEAITNTIYFLIINPNEGVISFEYEINEGIKENISKGKQIINDLNQRIIIPYQDWDISCKRKEICPIHITLKVISETSLKYKITIVPLSRSLRPVYLIPGSYFINGVSIKDPTYYYTNISVNNNYETVINFQRGSGNVIAKLVPKKCIEKEANWNRRVVLPTVNNKKEKEKDNACTNWRYKVHYVEFDYVNSKFVITTEVTNKFCSKGCEWYIGIDTVDAGLFQIFTYAIFMRSDDSTSVVSLPLSEPVFGSLAKSEVNSYRTKINKEMDEIIIDFKTGLCCLFINVGLEVPSSLKHDLMLPKSEMFSIAEDSPLIKDKHLNGKSLTFTIECLSNSYYTFKWIDTFEHLPTIIKLTTNSESTQCYIEDDRCFLMIKNHNFERFKHIYLYAYVNKKVISRWNNGVEIYVNIYESTYLDDNDIMKHMPNEERNMYSSEGKNERNQLYFEWNELPKENRYILITVKIKEQVSSKVFALNVMAFYQGTPFNYYPNPNRNKFFLLNHRQQSNFRIVSAERYLLDFMLIEGEKGSLSYDKYEIQWGNDKRYKNYSFMWDRKTGDTKDKTYVFTVTGKSGTGNIVFILHYSKIVNTLDLNQIRNLHYSNQELPISLSFYSSLREECENDIVVNVRININSWSKSPEISTIPFTINGIVTNEYITQSVSGEELSPEIGVEGAVSYNSVLNHGRVVLSCKDIREYISNGKYMYWTVTVDNDCNKSRELNATVFDLDLSVIPSGIANEIITVEENAYYFGLIGYSWYNTLRLPIRSRADLLIVWEFSVNSTGTYHDYDIAILCTNSTNIESHEVLRHNSTSNDLFFEGIINTHNIIALKLRYHSYCYFTIFRRSDWSVVSSSASGWDYLVKYKTMNSLDDHFYPKYIFPKTPMLQLRQVEGKAYFTIPKIRNLVSNSTYIFRVTNRWDGVFYWEQKGDVLYEKVFRFYGNNSSSDGDVDGEGDQDINVEMINDLINIAKESELFAQVLVMVYDDNYRDSYNWFAYNNVKFDYNVAGWNGGQSIKNGIISRIMKVILISLSVWLSAILVLGGVWFVYRKIRFKQNESFYKNWIDPKEYYD